MASALVDRRHDATFAWLTKPLNNLPIAQSGVARVSVTQFLNHVSRLAAQLPETNYAINLCDNRYLFAVCLCAIITKRATNLLPPNKNVATQESLLCDYTDALILHDGSCDISTAGQSLDVSTLDWSLDEQPRQCPEIDNDHLAVISFTSGSTGRPKPNLKFWRTLVQSSRINARYMLADDSECYAHIATVPGQHMWGFETSVLLPIFSNVALVDARPFFPSDITELVGCIPIASTLISAPVHLNSLCKSLENSPLELESLKSILCATAPLDADLAKRLEAQTSSTLKEVYGCSEVGSMAVRKTATECHWQPFSGLDFEHSEQPEGLNRTAVFADHLPERVMLEDHLQFNGNRFTLAGRNADQIKIAGKRGSLAEVNAVLLRFEGLIDGAVIFPEQSRAVPRLVALVALQEGANKAQLRAHMATYLDAAFVPRPILQVASLPREENGKLSKAKLLSLYRELVTPA